jgi:hypothetical protein
LRSSIIVLTSLLLISCNDNSSEEIQCPLIIVPVYIPPVTVNFFDENKIPLNVCDAIVTIDQDENNYHETLYGSSYGDCTTKFSLSGGYYDLMPHDVLVEKAGYQFQQFKDIVPVKTQCGYESFKLKVYLEVD